ncbi:hypothetical protein SPB21_03705 [Leptothoe sp. ISB3NOV94-8A]
MPNNASSKQRQIYTAYINSQAWREKRSQVLERDEYRCRICGFSDSDGLSLQVHHSSYENLGNEPLNQLVTLCTDCHPIADQCQKRQRKRLGQNNQVRMDPGAFLEEVESTEIVEIKRGKDDITKVSNPINRASTPTNAQRSNSRSAESLFKSSEGGIEQTRQDGRRF